MAYDLYTPPSDLQRVLEVLAAPFGGVEELTRAVATRDLEYLLTFPGFVYVVSPWGIEVDFQEHGYRPGSWYAVLDRDWRLLYTQRYVDVSWVATVQDRVVSVPYPVTWVDIEGWRYPVTPTGEVWVRDFPDGARVRVVVPAGRFGMHAEDRDLVQRQPHGGYVHVVFDGTPGPVLGVLLICNRRPLAYRQRLVSRWQEETAARAPRYIDAHELLLDVGPLTVPGPVEVWFVEGVWSDLYTYDQIRHHPHVHRYVHPAAVPLVLHFTRSGWVTFSQHGVQLVIRDIRGVGLRRLRESPDCTYYVQLHNDFIAAPHPRLPARPSVLSGSSWAGSEGYLRAEGVLGYRLAVLDQGRLVLVWGVTTQEPGHLQTDGLCLRWSFG